MVLFAGKTVLSMPERFECTSLAKKALYNTLPFLPFLSDYDDDYDDDDVDDGDVVVMMAAYCSDVDECALSSHRCHQHATCFNAPGSYKCHCNDGFTGTGFNCQGLSFD